MSLQPTTQASFAWVGVMTFVSSITRMLGWAARHPAILHRLTLEKPPPLHDGDQ